MSSGKNMPTYGKPVDISKHSKSTDNNSNNSNSNNQNSSNQNSKESVISKSVTGGGFFGWMRNTENKPKPSEAFLGEKNR